MYMKPKFRFHPKNVRISFALVVHCNIEFKIRFKEQN
jgi:hypothetical protein